MCRWLPLSSLRMLWLPLVPLVIPVVAPEPSESAMVASGPTGYSSGCPWAIWECNGCLWSPCLFQWMPLSHLRVQWLTLVPLVLPACCPCVRARECVRGILNAGWLTANLRICWSLLNHLSCPSWQYSMNQQKVFSNPSTPSWLYSMNQQKVFSNPSCSSWLYSMNQQKVFRNHSCSSWLYSMNQQKVL